MIPASRNIFTKIILFIILLLVPILLLYGYSNEVSVKLVEKEITTSNLNQLSFLMNQLDTNVEQLAMFPVILSSDPHIREFLDRKNTTGLDVLAARTRIAEKLSLQSVSSQWTNELTLYLPKERNVISSSIYVQYNENDLKDRIYANWSYRPAEKGGPAQAYFIRQVAEPARAVRADQANAVFQVTFSSANIVDMLDRFKTGGRGDPFLFHPDHEPILNSTADREAIRQVIPLIRQAAWDETGRQIVELNGKSFLVHSIKSKNLGWYLVDYVPMEQILKPITSSRNLFYAAVALLLAMSVLAAYMLYRNVQIPIRKLVRGVQRLRLGDFKARIDYRPNNEFDFLFHRFNEMAEQIQQLVEKVYAEKIRSREAMLKQLQSQINPHFLYNSLYFISNMAKLDDKEAVIAMAENLGDYYRYATRVEKQTVTVREELQLVRTYLTIQNLRLQRFEFEIDVPDAMLGLPIPRLLLQPLAENAVIHGLERKAGDGWIRIYGEQNDRYNLIVVEDNGAGVSDEKLRELQAEVEMPMTEEMGCGVWNVHQRLVYLFGEGSGLAFAHSPSGGLKVTVRWNRAKPLAEQQPNPASPPEPGE